MSNASRKSPQQWVGLSGIGLGAFLLLVIPWVVYQASVIEVGRGEVAVLLRKTGLDLTSGEEIAPDLTFKGVQREVLREGRYFYDPYNWDWFIVKQTEIPAGKIGVRVNLCGDDLPYGEFLAPDEQHKGIFADVLRPGRYAINPYVEEVFEYDPVTIPAGFKGVVTNLAGPLAKDPNQPLVETGERGVQKTTLDPGTYYLNPFVTRVSLVDCRNQRLDLGEEKDVGFPTRDGFWVNLDGIVEFRVMPEQAAEVFVLYNELAPPGEVDTIEQEVRSKLILPNARSFCRLLGSNSIGRDLISGDTRTKFQLQFQKEMREACEPLGIEIIQAVVTRIVPPRKIAEPVQRREIAKQQQEQYVQETKQQMSEQQLAIQKETVKQRQSLVQADQEVVRSMTQAQRMQEVAVTKANELLTVAKLKLEAAKDEASAIRARGQGVAQVVRFENEAAAAGWKQSVAAFQGDGLKFARYVLYQKLAPAYRSIMANTADSPIMDIFRSFEGTTAVPSKPGPSGARAPVAPE